MELINFILISYGLTFILVFGSIFNSIRPSKDSLGGLGKLFHCPLCMGFWAGIFLWSINKWTELFTFEYTLATAFCLGCLSAGTSYLLSILVDDCGLKINRGE